MHYVHTPHQLHTVHARDTQHTQINTKKNNGSSSTTQVRALPPRGTSPRPYMCAWWVALQMALSKGHI